MIHPRSVTVGTYDARRGQPETASSASASRTAVVPHAMGPGSFHATGTLATAICGSRGSGVCRALSFLTGVTHPEGSSSHGMTQGAERMLRAARRLIGIGNSDG